jgi:alpha-beta hydrolase superfamily lysophospholipase
MAMEEARLERIAVGSGDRTRDIAVLRRKGKAPGLFWLGGYTSDMGGTKATALDGFAAGRGLAFTRFDYSGHGLSGGDFLQGTISDWLEEAETVFDRFTAGPQFVLGSSMGGWIALLLASSLRARGESRIAGLVLLAPATDMTKEVIWDRFPKKVRAEIDKTGSYSQAGEDPTRNHDVVTRLLIEDGKKHLFGDRLIETGCPVHILHGTADDSVPWRLSTGLVTRLASDDVVLTLIKEGDHRLSRPEDVERLFAAVDGMMAEAGEWAAGSRQLGQQAAGSGQQK